MGAAIYPIQLGVGGCYVIKDQGTILVDAGAMGKIDDFEKALKKIPLDPEEIKLIVITHGHWDHVGSVKDIQKMTGAKIAMHQNEKNWLEDGISPLPPGVNGWGRFLAGLMGLFHSDDKVPTAAVDVVLDDSEFSLTEYGIAGTVIPSPGHSSGSVSVLLESGEAFVGDLAMNMFPLRLGPGLPIFADDINRVKDSWRKLLDRGVSHVYPAHGKSFSADIIAKAIV